VLRLLIVAAAAPFLVMGAAHGALTLRDLRRPRAFTPPDPALREAMRRSGVRLHPAINLWRAWLGFNLTHSLGLVLFGAAYAYVGVFAPGAFAASPLLQAVAVLVSATYAALSVAFFFATPALGSAAGLAGFVAAAALAHA
jgi:hypothetical protein